MKSSNSLLNVNKAQTSEHCSLNRSLPAVLCLRFMAGVTATWGVYVRTGISQEKAADSQKAGQACGVTVPGANQTLPTEARPGLL